MHPHWYICWYSHAINNVSYYAIGRWPGSSVADSTTEARMCVVVCGMERGYGNLKDTIAYKMNREE